MNFIRTFQHSNCNKLFMRCQDMASLCTYYKQEQACLNYLLFNWFLVVQNKMMNDLVYFHMVSHVVPCMYVCMLRNMLYFECNILIINCAQLIIKDKSFQVFQYLTRHIQKHVILQMYYFFCSLPCCAQNPPAYALL